MTRKLTIVDNVRGHLRTLIMKHLKAFRGQVLSREFESSHPLHLPIIKGDDLESRSRKEAY